MRAYRAILHMMTMRKGMEKKRILAVGCGCTCNSSYESVCACM